MSTERDTLAVKYMEELFAPESELHQEIRKAQIEAGVDGINIGPFEGYWLKYLIRTFQCRRALEVGCLFGYSALWIAEALPESGQLICLEKDPKNYEITKSFLDRRLNQACQFEIQLGHAKDLLPDLVYQPDFIFLDANKADHDFYIDWARKHVAPGGIIVADNCFVQGHIYGDPWREKISPKAVEAVGYMNKTMANDANFESIIIPTVEGMLLARKKS